MIEHPSNENLKKFLTRRMQPSELLKMDEHLAECDLCLRKAANLKPVLNLADFNFPQSSPEKFEHLSYEQLENYVDEKSDTLEREIADVHLEVCSDCRAQVNGLIEMREMIAADLRKPDLTAQTTDESIFGQIRNVFSGSYFLKFGFAAAAVLFVVSTLGIFWFLKPDSSAEIAVTNSPNINSTRDNQNPTINSPINIQQNVNLNSDPNAPANSKTEANATTNSENLPEEDSTEFPPQYQREIERVLANERLNLPAEIKELNNQSGTLMSGGTEAIPFALSAPVGKIILSSRPNFRWSSLAGAESYIVNVFDANFNKLASSPQISGTTWQIDKPLARGKIYLWQITAIKNGEEILSPVRPAPDAKFKVIDAKKANELAHLSKQYKNEHLFLGIMYANAGLLEEAEREFQREISKNPDSKQARKLLQDIRANRKTK